MEKDGKRPESGGIEPEVIRNRLRSIANDNMIDEIRFIDAEPLAPESLFIGRQPKDLIPGAKTLVLSSVYIAGFILKDEDPDEHGRISRLTLSGFYWNVVDPLKPLCDYLIELGYQAMIYDGLLEENCVPLKPAAVKAGLGWQGKCSLLISPKYGSFQALGGIVTDADLSEIYPMQDNHCGSCTACIDSCPAQAIESYGLDRTKCLSNLLEGDEMPDTVREMKDNYIFECDICQEACPWNRAHLAGTIRTGLSDVVSDNKVLQELLRFDSLMGMSEAEYNAKILPLFNGVDLPYELFRRNIKLAYNYKHKE